VTIFVKVVVLVFFIVAVHADDLGVEEECGKKKEEQCTQSPEEHGVAHEDQSCYVETERQGFQMMFTVMFNDVQIMEEETSFFGASG
jgi:hypothetical protein